MSSAQVLDEAFAGVQRRAKFQLAEDQLYFAGHSLGPATRDAAEHMRSFVAEQWAPDIVSGWNRHQWLKESQRASAAIAPLLGCGPQSIEICDSTSVNLFKLLSLALDQGQRNAGTGPLRVGIERGAFPGDRYVCRGLVDYLGQSRCQWLEFERADMAAALKDRCDVAICATVDYRSADRVDMGKMQATAGSSGCRIIWDLCHAVGAVPLALDQDGVEMAVGCTYKYLNGGPGAPAFAVYRPPSASSSDRSDNRTTTAKSALVGWFGHAEPFRFEAEFRPAEGAAQLACGTPSIVALKALNCALQAWEGVDLGRLRELGVSLANYFIEGLQTRTELKDLHVDSPSPGPGWGSHIGLRHRDAHAIVRCLGDSGVTADFRGPDSMRFAICPLYTRHRDIEALLTTLATLIREGRHHDEAYQVHSGVP